MVPDGNFMIFPERASEITVSSMYSVGHQQIIKESRFNEGCVIRLHLLIRVWQGHISEE